MLLQQWLDTEQGWLDTETIIIYVFEEQNLNRSYFKIFEEVKIYNDVITWTW